MPKRILYVVIVWCCCSLNQAIAFEAAVNAQLVADPNILTTAQRMAQWKTFIITSKDYASESERVIVANDFINRAAYSQDKEQFSESDYWAAPWEFIAASRGDCEDFAIAKLFTLQAMGIPAERLRLMYVTVRGERDSHMVTVYYPENGNEPWVLDNLSRSVSLAGQRSDLQPLFSFNPRAAWVMNGWQQGEQSVHPLKLPKWQRMVNDWQEQLLALQAE